MYRLIGIMLPEDDDTETRDRARTFTESILRLARRVRPSEDGVRLVTLPRPPKLEVASPRIAQNGSISSAACGTHPRCTSSGTVKFVTGYKFGVDGHQQD